MCEGARARVCVCSLHVLLSEYHKSYFTSKVRTICLVLARLKGLFDGSDLR